MYSLSVYMAISRASLRAFIKFNFFFSTLAGISFNDLYTGTEEKKKAVCNYANKITQEYQRL